MKDLAKHLNGLRLLIIDDDVIDRTSVRRALASGEVSAEIVEAANAAAGVQLLATSDFDCVFLDFNMPGHNGLWVIQQVRAKGLRVPIIVLTGSGDESTAVESMKAGATDYFSKAAITPERVVISLRQALHIVKVEAALRQSEQLALLAVEATQLGTWSMDPETRRLELSSRCRELLGLRPDEPATYERFLNALHPEDLERTRAAVSLALSHGADGAYDVEYRTVSAEDGRQHWVRAVGRVTFDRDGRPMRFTGTVQDVGERKQLEVQRARLLEAERRAREQAEAAIRLREDLVAVVSHDLRNPLSSVCMNLDVLRQILAKDREAQPLALKSLDSIARSTERMKRLISDLLDMAAIDNGAIALRKTPCDATLLLQEARDMFLPMATSKRIELDIAETPGDPALNIDKERVLQLFSNLIANAIKFTGEHGRISLSAHPMDCSIEFRVADTGQGISPEHMPHLFDRYWQAKQDGRLGVGLGLTIAKGIVEAHGGALVAESVVGEGTTFRFTLPRT